jgi:endoglucanase
VYSLHAAFLKIAGPECTLRVVGYLLGTRSVTSTSYVSGVGTHSRLIGYGNNRPDYTFIPSGMVPGFVIVGPDLDCKEDRPFLWFENEYVVPAVTQFILAANAADALVK